MRVLLIDDEPLARIGLRSVIPWEENGFTIVGEAENGAEGLRIAEQRRPDLILVDLIMPEMGGLEFIRQVKKLLPDCKIMIMTCMNGTEYYREAIRCGVSEYIQKDQIDPEEILTAVKRVAEEIRRDRVIQEGGEAGWVVNENVVLTEFLNLVLQGRISNPEGIREKLAGRMKLDSGRFAAIALRREQESAGEPADGALLDCSVLSLCQEIVSRAGGGFLFCTFRDGMAGILSIPEGADPVEYVRHLFQQMAETAEQYIDCVLTGGVSEVFHRPEDFGPAGRLAMEALEQRFLEGGGKLYRCSGITAEKEVARVETQRLLQACLAADTLAKFYTALSSAGQLPMLLSESGTSVSKAKGMYADLLYHLRSLLRREELDPEMYLSGGDFPSGYLEQSPTAAVLHRRLTGLAAEITEACRMQAAEASQTIADIRRYIELHLDERITLDVLAGQVFLSPSYVCRLYKRETGENLQAYILQQKLEKARQLLPHQSVGMTADALGFHSHSYFIRVFKERYGITPLQYQRKI